MTDKDLTSKEETNVRAALRFLRLRCGGWGPLASAIGFKDTSLSAMAAGHKAVSAKLTFRIARFAKVTVDAVLTGQFPSPGTCPHCGHQKEDAA
jgi:hypothetical protein